MHWVADNWLLLVTAAVAVYGAVLATLTALPRRERVSITRVFPGRVSTPEADLRVELVNTGQRHVPIRAVGMHLKGSERPMIFLRVRGETRLAPGDRAIYVRPFQDLGKFKGATPDQVWIAVRSHQRELDRVNGAGALPLLEEYFSAKQ